MHGMPVRVMRAAVVVALVAAAVGVGFSLQHNGSGDARRTGAVVTSAALTTAARYSLPVLGAAGFPASTYPLARRGRQPGTVAACPSPVSLAPPTARTGRQAARVVRRLETRTFTADLHATDRAYWPGIRRDWRHGYAHPQPAHRAHILHAGLLSAPWPRLGVPDPRHWVRESCGDTVMHDSYVVATGPVDRGALQSADVFVVRGGRALLYFNYP